MSGTSAEPAWTARPPARFDIVTCFYPENSGPNQPGLKLRPGLVISVLRGKSSGLYACDIAYGTKKLKLGKRLALDLIIQNAGDLTLLGLARATRFDLDNIARLPWNSKFFGCWTGNANPIIGSLTEKYIKDFAYMMMRRGSV